MNTNIPFVKGLILLFISLLISFTLAEVIVRGLGSNDEDGNFFFKGVRILPFRLPIKGMEKMISQLNDQRTHRAMYIYDPLVGWTYREHHTSEYYGPMYQHTTNGIRTGSQDIPIATESNKLRIAIFGDSFTHGDDVKFEESWGHVLEENLRHKGFDVEVLNFGLGGGGMDQAYLRWKNMGKKFSPKIVIFGFYEDDRLRNVSIIRAVQNINNGLPYSKPRFILENNGLRLINSPTTTPEDNLTIMKNMTNWDLVDYETFYKSELFKEHYWSRSKFLSLIYTRLRSYLEKNTSIFPGPEEDKLALEIIKLFKSEVEQTGSKFFLVHLPTPRTLSEYLEGKPLYYKDILDHIKSEISFIETPSLFEHTKNASGGGLFSNHYNPKGNKLVADDVTAVISKELEVDIRLKH